LPIVQCSAHLDPEEKNLRFCILGVLESSGVCCEKITNFKSDVVFLERPIVTRRSLRSVNEDELRIAFEVSKSLISNATEVFHLSKSDSPDFGQGSQRVIQLGKNCLIAMETARRLSNRELSI